MGLTIHMTAQELRQSRRFGEQVNQLSKTLGHLSSGIKVRASEIGSAQVQVDTRITSELKSTKAELRGLSSNASLLQTLEGALAEANASLQTLRELAVQAGNTQVSLTDRQNLEARFHSIIDEIKAIAQDTQYNGLPLLDGQRETLDLSIISDRQSSVSTPRVNQSVLHLPNLNPIRLGEHVSYVGQGRGVFLSPLDSGQIEINGIQIRGTVDSDDRSSYSHRAGSAIAKAAAINASSHLTGVNARVDMNIYRGFTKVKGFTLNSERWIKLNGEVISAFTFNDMDSTGSLRAAINREFTNTGVMASIDTKGQLLLAAPDGRNISLEFSDVELRNALGIRDLYGDDVNFSPDVDPPEYVHYGDITSVDYVNHANKVLENSNGNFTGSFEILDSRFTKAQDNIDYIFEVVKAGILGEARFRVKEEIGVDTFRDDLAEDYLFNAPGGELEPPSPNKVRIISSDYKGGSELQIGIRVITPGSPQSQIESERPLVEILVSSLDDPSVAARSLGQFRISNEEDLDLRPYGVEATLNFPIDDTRYLLDQNQQQLNLKQGIPPTHLPDEHDYDPLQPQVRSWDGIHSADIKIEIIGSGHSIGERDYSFTNEEAAKVRVTADLLHQNRTVVHEYSLDEINHDYLTGIGANGSTLQGSIGIRFPSAFGKAAKSQNRQVSGDYNRNPNAYTHHFVGTETREYEYTFTSDGILSSQTNDGGPSVDVKVYGFNDQGQRQLLQSYSIDELDAGKNYFAGLGDQKDGFYIQFPRGATLVSVDKSRDPGAILNIHAYRYNDLEAREGVIEITKAGIDTGARAAEYKYYYSDDPSNIIGTGKIDKRTNLPDSTLLESSVTRSWQSEIPEIPKNTITIRDFGYSRSHGDQFSIEMVEESGKLMLQTTWSPDSENPEIFQSEFKINTYLDMGNGMKVYVYRSRIEDDEINVSDLKFTGQVDSINHFLVGDTFTYGVKPNLAAEGDTFTIRVEPVDLSQGAEWNLTAIGPDWKPNDTYYAHLGTGFDQEVFTITDRLSYPFGSTDGTLGEIKVSGFGRFEVGDQIRVGTRGFVGKVETTGAYTNPAFPTDYVLTVTKSGNVSEAELTWVRADGLNDTEHGGNGTLSGLVEGEDAYLEEGVFVSFNDIGQGAYLAEGDQIYISVGQNLEYTFGGQVTLHSREAIDLDYSDNTVDRQLGKLSFTGTDEEALSARYHDLSLAKTTLHRSAETSLERAGIMSSSEVDRALTTIDTALSEINDARIQVGSRLSLLAQQQDSLSNKVAQLSGLTQRLTDVDYAEAVSTRTSAQIRLMSTPMLNQVAKTNALRVLD